MDNLHIIIGRLLAVTIFVLLFSIHSSGIMAPAPPAAPSHWTFIEKGLTGNLYGDAASIQAFKRQGIIYWGVMVKNDFTDAKYLRKIQDFTQQKSLTGSMSFYLFQPGNKVFSITNIFYINNKDEVLLQTTPEANVGSVLEDQDAKKILLYVIDVYKKQNKK